MKKKKELLQTSNNSGYTAALERIIRWALGEIWSFRPREEGDGVYYWRKELRKRFNAAKKRHKRALKSVEEN